VLVDLMNELLQDEVPPGMPVQRRDRQRLAERRQVPVQIADHHDLVGIVKRDDRPRAPGGRAHQLGGFADGREDFLGVRHGGGLRSSAGEKPLPDKQNGAIRSSWRISLERLEAWITRLILSRESLLAKTFGYEACSIDRKALDTHLRLDPAVDRFLKCRIACSRSVRYQS